MHFQLQRVFVWARNGEFALRTRVQVRRYLVVAGAQYVATAAATSFLPRALGVPVRSVYLATVVAMSALTFLTFRTLVFHTRRQSTDRSTTILSMVSDVRGTGIWPKEMPELTPEQHRVREDFAARWLEVLPRRYGLIERFNHGYPLGSATRGRTLEIGAGLGEHVRYEDLEQQEYYTVELREELVKAMRARHDNVNALVGDCQERLPFDDGFFDRVLAVHVLEHLPDLPRALDEISRVLARDGRFSAVIPCEGGLVYSLARRISAQRLFEREFGMPYDWCIRSEHLNIPREIFSEVRKKFAIENTTYFPISRAAGCAKPCYWSYIAPPGWFGSRVRYGMTDPSEPLSPRQL